VSVVAEPRRGGDDRLQQLRDGIRAGAGTDTTPNAIEFVVVADGATVPSALQQRLLLVRFLRPDGLAEIDPAHVRIAGGVRVVDPTVRWAEPLDRLTVLVPDPDLGSEEARYLEELAVAAGAEAPLWLAVGVEQEGDHSTYVLRVREDEDSVPDGFDRTLSEVSFSFKVACPSPFDCVRTGRPAVDPEEEPELDHLARDFLSFRDLMFDRIALIAPDDRSRDPATLRALLVEALASAADQVAYFQDAVATEAYLGTARARSSVRRHARLLDYQVHEGCAARAFVQLVVRPGTAFHEQPQPGNRLRPVVAPGAALLTRLPNADAVVGPEAVAAAVAGDAEVFEVVAAPATVSGAHTAIALHSWGARDHVLPAGATGTTLVSAPGVRLAAGDLLVLEQHRSPRTLRGLDADPQVRHVVRLTEVGDPHPDQPFSPHPVVDVAWGLADALPFELPVVVDAEPVAVARGNILVVDHGATVVDEPLELVEWGHDRAGRRATLGRRDLAWTVPLGGSRTTSIDESPAGPVERAALRRVPASAAAADLAEPDPRAARPALRVTGEGEQWHPVRDLLSSVPSARELVVEPESDGRARLRWGDDVLGRRPAVLDGYTATYRIGRPAAGNVGAEAIAHVVAHPTLWSSALLAALVEVRNPLPARGGTAPESLEAVKRYAPQAFRIQQRAVTEADWVERAQAHPRVQRAQARLRWTGSWHTVHVTVDPVGGGPFDDALRTSLMAWLQPFRLAGYDLELVPPAYAPLDIALTVCVHPGHHPEDVEQVLMAELGTGVLPDGRRGFFHPDALTFGDSIWLSQVVARCTAVEGVRFVEAAPGRHDNRFARWGRPQGDELERGRILIGPSEIARCDNDPNIPDHGRIQLFMEGGT
jgi:hypothetical protein